MRFELSVALKYILPKWRQLSVSIISLVSILVISLVVWLVVIFLSVTEGIEQKWISELVSLNAPLRMTPTDAYYRSYFYQIDQVSSSADYRSKTIGEKLLSSTTDPYDPQVDMELPDTFPTPDWDLEEELRDPVKEGFAAIHSLPYRGVRPQEYEVEFGQLHLQIAKQNIQSGEQCFVTQVSYVASHDSQNTHLYHSILPPTADDYNNLLHSLAVASSSPSGEKQDTSPLAHSLRTFFQHLEIISLRTATEGFPLSPPLYPSQGSLQGIAIVCHGHISTIYVPPHSSLLTSLTETLSALGYATIPIQMHFTKQALSFSVDPTYTVSSTPQLILSPQTSFNAHLLSSSLEKPDSLSALAFQIEGKVQNLPIRGAVFYKHLAIEEARPIESPSDTGESEPFWLYRRAAGGVYLPSLSHPLGEGILVSKHLQKNGVHLGDRGHLAYYSQVGSSLQEQQVSVYVAGFYDPGMIPVGNKLLFANASLIETLRGSSSVSDPMLGNGIHIWLDHIRDAKAAKRDLIQLLRDRGIEHYWQVQSYHDYEFTKPILDQLQSDKSLFTLIAIIILIVACSNIISMLILLVNDKKKEIGTLQAMGASPTSIALIFGICGCTTGLISCLLGVATAILTLRNLQSLVNLLSFLQGREAFQTAFYGATLPHTLSYTALAIVSIATLFISLLAGIVPALRASKIRPTEMLKVD
jgi:lipoprotein-releasing system permease protein